LWDLTSGTVLQTLQGDGRVLEVAVLPDGQRALSGSHDGTLTLWDLTAGTVLQTLKAHAIGVTAMAVLPDGQRALSGSWDPALTLWDLTTGIAITTFDDEARVTCLSAVTADRCVAGNGLGRIYVLQVH
jgi:WD40 repeat protein